MQHVAVRVEEIVLQRAVHLPRDQPGPADVPRVQGARRADLGHDVLPVPQVDVRRRGAPASGRFAVPQAVRTVGEAGGTGWTGNSFQLPKSIIRPRFGAVNRRFCELAAVSVVGVGCGRNARRVARGADEVLAVLTDQTVVEIVGVGDLVPVVVIHVVGEERFAVAEAVVGEVELVAGVVAVVLLHVQPAHGVVAVDVEGAVVVDPVHAAVHVVAVGTVGRAGVSHVVVALVFKPKDRG